MKSKIKVDVIQDKINLASFNIHAAVSSEDKAAALKELRVAQLDALNRGLKNINLRGQ